jgi:NADH-quinone oxidoreductase subunit N
MIHFLIPDLLLLILPFLIVVSRIFSSKRSLIPWYVAFLGLITIFVLLNCITVGETQLFLSNWKVDRFGILMREFLVLAALMGISFSKDYFNHTSDFTPRMHQLSEFMGTVIMGTFGGVVVISASDLLTFFIGLELATIPMYALTAWNKKDSEGSEAATKYILMGSVATAFELFGFSYLYGFSGSMHFTDIAASVLINPSSPLLWISVLFLLSGIGFKLTLFPFHTWAPDVYEGAPTPVTAILSVTSKAVAISFVTVLVFGPLNGVKEQMAPFLALLAGTTLFVGNLGALKQYKLRRFMAYSSISQAGYLLIALLGPYEFALSSIVYYLFIYAFSNFLTFFIFGVIERNRPETFDSLRGLSKESPILAVALVIALFSLAGIPPLAGFLGKFQLFYSAAQNHHYVLITFAILNNVLALYYYIQLIKSAWVEPADPTAYRLIVNLRQKVWIIILSVAILLGAILPFLNDNIFKIINY